MKQKLSEILLQGSNVNPIAYAVFNFLLLPGTREKDPPSENKAKILHDVDI